jgi:hypothetical protein
MCGQTADWNNRRATPSANDEVRERERSDSADGQRESKKTMVFVMVFAALARPVFTPKEQRRASPGVLPA